MMSIFPTLKQFVANPILLVNSALPHNANLIYHYAAVFFGNLALLSLILKKRGYFILTFLALVSHPLVGGISTFPIFLNALFKRNKKEIIALAGIILLTALVWAPGIIKWGKIYAMGVNPINLETMFRSVFSFMIIRTFPLSFLAIIGAVFAKKTLFTNLSLAPRLFSWWLVFIIATPLFLGIIKFFRPQYFVLGGLVPLSIFAATGIKSSSKIFRINSRVLFVLFFILFTVPTFSIVYGTNTLKYNYVSIQKEEATIFNKITQMPDKNALILTENKLGSLIPPLTGKQSLTGRIPTMLNKTVINETQSFFKDYDAEKLINLKKKYKITHALLSKPLKNLEKVSNCFELLDKQGNLSLYKLKNDPPRG